MKKYYLIIFFSVLHFSLSAQLNQWEWLRVAGSNSNENGKAVACDPSGNVYTTGFIEGPGNDFSGTIVNATGNDIFITKHDPSGNLLWVKRAGSSGDDRGFGIACDPFGNIYICGYFHSSATFFGSPSIVLTSVGGRDIFVAKYDAAGNVVWAKRAGSTTTGDIAYGIAVDSNSVYIAGTFEGTLNMGALPPMASLGASDVFIASYNLTTGLENWAKSAGSTGDDIAHGIDVNNNELFVAGEYRGTSINFAPALPALPNAGGTDAFITKFSTTGTFGWQRRIGAGDEDIAWDVDAYSNFVYVVGSFKSGAGFYNASGGPVVSLSSAGNKDGFLAQYSSSTGNVNWALSESGTDDDITYSVSVNSLGQVLCAGAFKGILPLGPLPGISAVDFDVFVTKYSSAGSILWGIGTDGDNKDEAYGLAVSNADMAYVTGYSKSDPIEFDPFFASDFGGDDIFLAKLKCSPPVLSVSPVAAVICNSSSVLLVASGANNYVWSPSSTLSSAVNDSVVAAPLSTTTYTVVGNNAAGCSSTPVPVTVSVLPVIANNTISSPQTICSGTAPSALTGTTPTGATGSYSYLWESSSDNIVWASAPGVNTLQNYSSGVLAFSTYFRRIVSSGSCSPLISSSILITVQPVITGNTISAAQTICSGGTPASLTGSAPSGGSGPYVYLWEQSADAVTWTPAAGVNNAISYNPPALTASTYYRRTVSAGVCPAVTSSNILITVLPPLSANAISAGQVICEGNTPASLTGTAPSGGSGTYTYLWEQSADNISWTPASGLNTAASYAPPMLLSSMYYRRNVNSFSCFTHTSNSILITVQPAITNNLISADQVLCSGDTAATLLSSAPSGGDGIYSYVWMQSPDQISWTPATGAGTGSSYSPGAPADTVFYSLEISSGACSGSFSSVSNVVNVSILPALSPVTITTDQGICAGSTPLPLNSSPVNGGNGSYTYSWMQSADLLAWSAASGISNLPAYAPGALTDTIYYSLEIASGACAGSFAASSNVVTIVVEQPLTANTITSDQSVCQGFSTSILTGSSPSGGSGSYAYLWESSADSIVWTPATGINNLGTYDPGSLSFTAWFRRVVSSGICSSQVSDPVKITVHPAITGNSISSSQTLCAGGIPASLTSTPVSGGDGSYLYEWLQSNDSVNWVAAAGINNTAVYSPPALADTTYYQLIISSGACSDSAASGSTVITMTVEPAISSNVISGSPAAVCNGVVPAPLFASLPSGGDGIYTYLWEESVDNLLWTPAAGYNIGSDYYPPLIVDTLFYRRHVLSGACSSVTAAEMIAVYSLSFAALTGNDTICSGTPAALDLTFNGTGPWDLVYTDGLNNFTLSGIATPSAILSFSPATSASYSLLSCTDGNGCDATISGAGFVDVVETPVANAGIDPAVCGLSVNLNAIPSAGDGVWTSSISAAFSPADISPSATATVNQYGSYVFTWTETNRMCISQDQVTVSFYEPPDSAYAGVDDELFPQNFTSLSGAAADGGQGTWSVISGAGIFSDVNDPHSPVVGLAPGENVLLWTITNGTCPSISDTVVLFVQPLLVPEGFSPNGDGINDLFVIPGAEEADLDLNVFNRWGNRVYGASPYRNDWNGTNASGQELSDDTYFYVLKLKDREMSGYVIIKRQ